MLDRPATAIDLGRLLDHPGAATTDYDLNPDLHLPEGRVLRPAAVLVAVWELEGRQEVVLTQRASQLRHHPGQVAFPGGKIDPEDLTPERAALRESLEEIGLQPAAVQVLGRLPCHETVTNFQITPILARITGAFTPHPEAGEVAEIFNVPLLHLLDPDQYRIERRLWRGAWRRYYTVPWGPYYIWGATARILRGMAGRFAE